RWSSSSQRGAYNRFKNKSRRRIRVASGKQRFEIIRTGQSAARKSLLKRTVIAEARSDVPPLRQQWLIRRSPRDVTADAHRPNRPAVIALPPRQDAIASRLSRFEMKLAH